MMNPGNSTPDTRRLKPSESIHPLALSLVRAARQGRLALPVSRYPAGFGRANRLGEPNWSGQGWSSGGLSVLALRWRGVMAAVLLLLGAGQAGAQTLRFSNHREVKIPEYANLRIGPLYSSLAFSQTAGYRYMYSDGAGVDYLYGNNLGQIKTNGSEFPLVSVLETRNYLVISKTADLDMSARASYRYYPLETSENELDVDFAEEGIAGTLSTEFELTPFMKSTISDDAKYRTDYVDTRGLTDTYGGSEYVFFHNRLGMDLDWLMARDQNLGLTVHREDNVPMEDGFKDQEYVDYNAGLTFEQKVTVFMVAGVAGKADLRMYDSTNRAETAQSYSASVFANIKLTERSLATVSAGYATGSTEDEPGATGDGQGQYSTAIGQLSVETRITPTLSHSYGAARSFQGGFDSEFDTVDTLNYKVDWSDEVTILNLFATLNRVVPSRETIPGYTDLGGGASVSHPVTKFATVIAGSSYSVRSNERTDSGEPTGVPEMDADYTTWDSRIGTSFAITREVTFSTTYQYVARDSDNASLSYSQGIFTADLTYAHSF